MNFQPNKIYKINPEFEKSNDTFVLSRFNTRNQNGLYFHRFVDGETEATELSFFTDAELDDKTLIEA